MGVFGYPYSANSTRSRRGQGTSRDGRRVEVAPGGWRDTQNAPGWYVIPLRLPVDCAAAHHSSPNMISSETGIRGRGAELRAIHCPLRYRGQAASEGWHIKSRS